MLKELAEKAKRIDIKEIALGVAKANSELILNSVKGQLVRGIAADGQRVGRYKSKPYSIMKAKISRAPFGVADLKLTGQLYENMYTEIKPDVFTIDSDVPYSLDNKERYGEERIYGLTENNQTTVRNKNSVDIVKEYSSQLGL